MENSKIKRVLISVTDKEDVVNFARVLSDEFNAEIISTGGTYKVIKDAGIKVKQIDEITHFPEIMDGRVKTLHPCVHGGLLARRDLNSHMEQAKKHDIGMIDMVVVNLYAFKKTVDSGADFSRCIENIDIGGPSMLRSAAKNFASVTVVTDPNNYDLILEEMRVNNGATTYETRRKLALEVFQTTNSYDAQITKWLGEQIDSEKFSKNKVINLHKKQSLRYGENPAQIAAFYIREGYKGIDHSLANACQHQGKELSYNNYLDLDAAWSAVREYEAPACVIVKHLTPCGVCQDKDIVAAYMRAHECDPVSAFGGVMAFNREVTPELVQAIFNNGQFVEGIIAPSFCQAALDMYSNPENKRGRLNARLLSTGGINKLGEEFEFRSVEGGLLVQKIDSVCENLSTFTFPTEKKPTDLQLEELVFAWKACKSVKSNAILIAKDFASVGVGAGQPNRVNSARIASEQAGDKAQGAVAASDAFFPFADGLEVLINAGVTAVIQPGGSIRDKEVIETADKHGIAMVFTGTRHFRH